MTLVLLWRTVSVCLWAAGLFLCLNCHVGCTDAHKEAQRAESPQDIRTEEELGQMTHLQKPETIQSFSVNEHFKKEEEEHQKEEDVIKGMDNREQYLQGIEVEVPAVERFVAEGTEQYEHQPKQNSENQALEATNGYELVTTSPFPSSEPIPGFPADLKHGSIQHIQDKIPDSILDHATDVPDVLDSDLPLVDCEVEPNPFDSDSSPPVVLENTSNAHTAGTKTHSDPPLGSQAAHTLEHLEANASHMLKEQTTSSPVTTDIDSSVSSKDPEDIPTFDEWKRKMIEVEKEKTMTTHTSTNGAAHPVKKVQKNFNNYASVECGAKILGANSEAKTTSAILKENMDLYMLNPCSNKIWFIIELCEPIQVKQLDIANFELFSSTPKDFLVYISDRYPTNKWLKLGTFHARDERTVQSFPLNEQLYAKYVKMFTKYIKVELVSHFGSEHFCPLSLIRVFGTSMVEEYEEIADPSERPEEQDDDMDYPPGYAPGDANSKNLIGSAKDAILNMVNNIAVNVLGGSQEMPGNMTSQEMNMTEPLFQLEPTTETTATDLPSVPHLEDLSETLAPTSDTQKSETPDIDSSNQELPLVEDQIVIPLEKDEEEPISSTIIHLGKEEGQEEEEDKHDKQQQERRDYCVLLPSFSPTCSCGASLQEFLLQQCSLLMVRKCKCHTAFYPHPQQPQTEIFELLEKEQDSLPEPESRASSSEKPQPPHKESEPLPIEPSLTLDLLNPGATDSSSVETPIPTSETSQLVSKELDTVAEEEHIEPTGALSSSHAGPSVGTLMEDASLPLLQEKPNFDLSQQEIMSPDTTGTPQVIPPRTPSLEHYPDATISPDVINELSQPDTLDSEVIVVDSKMEDLVDDVTSSGGNSQLPRPSATASSLSEIYAETPNATEQNENLVHGSSQKESVFMRLNNRIKVLEMNMSLSGRYLEQLSQRYRKQMEEMQKAFNKTIIKLQNTSRVAEEQDLRQTESIQLLQGQLENVTQLVLNLSVTVSQLQNEVSDRESYLLLSLMLCLCLGLLLYVQRCRISCTPSPEPPIPESDTYWYPDRQSSCDEAGLKRSASYPLIHSDSFQFATTMGPEMQQNDETQSLCPANRKRRRRKMKSLEKVETLKPSIHAAPEVRLQNNGAVLCNGLSVLTNPTPLTRRLLQPTFRDSPSEGSSEASSHSDDPSFCGITTACSRICDGLPPPKTRAEKRALRRRRPKPTGVVDYLKAPSRAKRNSLPIYTIHDVINRKEQSSGTYGVNVNLSGPV